MKYNDINIQNRILEQVNRLIFEKGVKGWNMDQLAELSGLAKNTLYRVIGKKEDVIEKVVLQYIHRIQTQLVPIISSDKDYMVSLGKLMSLFPELLDGFYTEHMKAIFLEYPSIEQSVFRHRDEITGSIISFFNRGVKEGFLREDLEAEVLFSTLQSIVMGHSRLSQDKEQMKHQLEEAFNYIVFGIKK